MLSYITFPIRILLSALLLGGSTTTPAPQYPIESQLSIPANTTISFEYQSENEAGTFFEAVLKDIETGKELGRVVFSYNKFNKSGYVARLHVAREERGNSYGSKLLNFALEKLTTLQCSAIYWQAYPFDLFADQTSEGMLPKLIAFYKRHGAQVLSQTGTSAQMAYYPQIA